MDVFGMWREDPEFNALPEPVRVQAYTAYFEKEMADDEFRALPIQEQNAIFGNYLQSQDVVPVKLPGIYMQPERSLWERGKDALRELQEPPIPALGQIASGITQISEIEQPAETKSYDDIISRASQAHNIEPDLIRAIIGTESSGDPEAVSPKGAGGLMQLMPETAKMLGVKDSLDPEQNIMGGTKYLRQMLDRFDGDEVLALAAYNAGPGNVTKHGGVPPFKETQDYVRKISERRKPEKDDEKPKVVIPANISENISVRKQLYPGEDTYFKNNPHVTGMAAKDDKIILNPYSQLTEQERQGVVLNESARLYMRKNNIIPDFEVTKEQLNYFKGTPYENNIDATKQTVAARIISKDPSIKFTSRQEKVAANISRAMGSIDSAKAMAGLTPEEAAQGRPISTITGKPVPTAEEKAAGGKAAMAVIPYGFASAVRGAIPSAAEKAIMQPITKGLTGKDYISPIDEAVKIGKYLPEGAQTAIGIPSHMAGAIVPLGLSFKTASAIMKAAKLPPDLVMKTGPVMDQIAAHVARGGLAGAIYGGLEGGTPKAMAEDAAFFGALEGGLGAVGGIFRKIFKSNWYRNLEVKERGLVVQSLEDLQKAGHSEGTIIRTLSNSAERKKLFSAAIKKRASFEKLKVAEKPKAVKPESLAIEKLKQYSKKAKAETPTMLKVSDKVNDITLGTLVDHATKDPAKALKHAADATVSKAKLIEGLKNKGLKAMAKAKTKAERVEIAKNLEETLRGIEEGKKLKPKEPVAEVPAKEPLMVSKKGRLPKKFIGEFHLPDGKVVNLHLVGDKQWKLFEPRPYSRKRESLSESPILERSDFKKTGVMQLSATKSVSKWGLTESGKAKFAEVAAKQPQEMTQEKFVKQGDALWRKVIKQEKDRRPEKWPKEAKKYAKKIGYFDVEKVKDISIKEIAEFSRKLGYNEKQIEEYTLMLELAKEKNIPEDWHLAHEIHIKEALRSGKLTPEKYTELHEKDYGPLEKFVPEVTEIVKRALKDNVVDIDQLSLSETKALNYAVENGILEKARGGAYPVLHTVYAKPGYDFKGEREKTLEELKAAPKIPKFKNTEEALAFGKTATPEQIKTLKTKREKSLSKSNALKNKGDLQGAMDEAVKGQLFREAIESAEGKVAEPGRVEKPKVAPIALKKSLVKPKTEVKPKAEEPKIVKEIAEIKAKTKKPISETKASDTAGDIGKTKRLIVERKTPLLTKGQKDLRTKKKLIKEKQLKIENAKEAKKQVHKMIRERRQNLNLAAYETNLFINDIEQQTSRKQREVVPFIIEKTDIPKSLNRPDLKKIYEEDRGKLDLISLQIKDHFDAGWQKMKENIPNMSAEQIENYVTHIWDLNKDQKRMVTNWFITQNRFLKKRYIETLKEGIDELGLTPKTLDIGEIVRIHDGVASRAIENKKFVDELNKLKKDGVPLIERADKAPHSWVYFDHPALRRGLVVPGKLKMGEKVSPELSNLLTEMGVAIGRRISPTAFGKPVMKAGEYKSGEPPEVRFQRFMSNRTIAHEIGHHLDEVLKLGDSFLNNYKSELYEINRERIESRKGVKGKYGEKYARSTEEQIAEFFATLFTDAPKAYKIAPNATADALNRLRQDEILTKLIDFDFEKQAKNLIEEQLSTLVKLPVKVHPDLKKPLKVIFDSRIEHPTIQAYEMLNGILKKTNLSLSLFHHGALGETGVALMGLPKTANIYFNPVKIYKAMVQGKFDVFEKEPIARDAIKHGLQIGATADIPVNMIQSKLNNLARKTKNVPLVNKTTAFIRTFNEVWDKALWNYLHDTLKIYAYESLVSKIDLTKNAGKQKQEMAQFVNDTFGGQNWDTLMVSPKTLQIMSWSLLSPDWTTSTVRQALSPTGIGKIHKETIGLRRKMGSYFWIKAGLYFGIGINLLNHTFRKWDEEKYPEYYKGIEKRTFLDRTMIGNTMGQKTYLFVGRYEDGTERYVRWGKQFRELPELFIDDTGFSPISATLKKVGGKLAPMVQLTSKITTGTTPSGYRDDDVYGKKGWDRVHGIAKALLKSPFPFATRSLFQEEKEFKITDIAMPSSKGMTRWKSINLFKHAIIKGDERLLKETYQFTLMNNLPAYTLFSTALTILKAESTKELTKGIKTVEDVEQVHKRLKDPKDFERLMNRHERIIKENMDRKLGIKLLDQAIRDIEIYKITENTGKSKLKKSK